MKKFLAPVLVGYFLLLASVATAQTRVPLKQALDEVTRLFGTKFVYERAVVENKTTTVDVAAQKGKPIEDVLKSILYPNKLLFLYVDQNHYTIVRNTERGIPLQPAPEADTTPALLRNISGTVVSATNTALIGVNITSTRTRVGTTTDNNGRFTLNVPSDDVLNVTFVGYQAQEVAITGDDTIRIIMSLAQNQLDEVVVVAYGTETRKDLTGSVSVISGKEIADLPPTINLEQAMQGRAAGVMVMQESGQPGSATRVRIRGSSSLLGSNQPLYVVDGIPVVAEANIPDDGSAFNTELLRQGLNSPLNNLSPADIESISILKDASATAIYGSRAANGVVIISTKQGKGKPAYNLNTSLSFQKALTDEVLNAQQFREIWTEAAMNSTSTAAVVQDILDGTYFGTADTDWEKEISPANPVTKNINFSVSGAGDKLRYYISFGAQDQQAIIKNANYTRYTLLANFNLNVSKKVKIGTSINLSHSSQGAPHGTLLARIYSYRPDIPVYDSTGNFAFSNYHNFENPVAMATATNRNNTGMLLGQLFGEVTIARDFIFRSSLGLNYNSGRSRSFYPGHTGTGGFTRSGPGPGYAQEGSTEFVSTLWENTLNYDRTFGNKHVVKAVLGASWQGDNAKSLQASGEGFPDDKVLTNLTSATQNFSIFSNHVQSGLISWFGRVNYHYDNRYMLTLSARTDGSSKFAEENKWAFFPTVALAWRLSGERFFRSLRFIDDLKLRVSTGVTGQQNFGHYQWRTLFQASNYGGMPAVIQSQLGNSRLRWELTRQTDIGLDFSILDYRINGSFDVYEKNTSDLLYFFKTPGNVGFTTVIGNLGSTRNKGIELALDAFIIRNKNFTWNFGINIAHNTNKLVKLNNDFLNKEDGFITPPNTGSRLKVGETIGLIYGYVAEGIIQTKAEIDELNAGSSTGVYQAAATAPGDIRFKDINGDGRVTSLDQTIIGNALPEFSGGITNTIEYKGLRLSALFTYSAGNDLRWGTLSQGINFASVAQENKMLQVMNRWTPQNPTNQPRAVYGDPNSNGRVSSFYVYDGSYLRLKNLHLSYTLPQFLLQKTKLIKTAMVYLSGANLVTITKYPGANPETSNLYNDDVSTGLDNSRFPISKVYTVGIQVGF